MKIVIEEDPALRETQVLIRCRARDSQVLGMVAALGSFGQRLTGEREGQTYLLEAGEVLYAESVDKRTFLYTKAGVYETPLRLYELEERLAPRDFVRASKSAVVNFSRVQSIRPDLGGRLQLTLENGERLGVSRQYAPAIKEKLGIIEKGRKEL